MSGTGPRRVRVYVDADACPVKDEVYRVAARYRLPVFVVSNRLIHVPPAPLVERVVVDAGSDVADDWIAGRVVRGDLVITADIPLAARCLRAGAEVLHPAGRRFDDDSIGMSLATRDLVEGLRAGGTLSGGGPPPFSARDRSAFLDAMDAAVQRLRRAGFVVG